MDADLPQHEGLEARIAIAIAPSLGAMGYELVRVQVQGKERPTVQIMADRADGSLIGVSDCEAISHAVGAVLDVDDPFPGEWSLEVSSAGIDRPLTRTKDWTRFLSHLATAELHVPQEGRRRFKGRILSADEETVRLKLEEGGAEVALLRSNIRRAKLVLTDELIAATAVSEAEAPETVAEAPPAPRPARIPGPRLKRVPTRRGPGRFSGKAAATTEVSMEEGAEPASQRPPSERN